MQEEIYKNLSLEDLPGEEWRDVVGYEGLYQVSNLGRVKSIDRKVSCNGGLKLAKGRIIHQFSNGRGYLNIPLSKDGYSKRKYVHRLVCESFIGNIGDLEINHIDKCKTNNNVNNLEICTRAYNMAYSKEDIMETVNRKCYMYDESGNFVREYKSISKAAKDNGLTPPAIVGSCTLHRKKGLRIHFRYDKVDKIEIQDRKRRKVVAYNLDGSFAKEYKSSKEAANELHVKENTIVCTCIGKNQTCKGYILKYA